MKVLHVPFCFYPDSVGGTEVYVDSLARHMIKQGVDCVIAAPATTEQEQRYLHKGVKVFRFPGSASSRHMLHEVYGEGDPHAAVRFGNILDQEQPDVVHLHAFTRGVSLLVAREVKRRGIKLVYTYHTPTASCLRGTLMRGGTEVCDGVLNTRICTRCTLQSHGINGFGGRLLSMMPAFIGRALGTAGLEGKVWTGLRMTELVELRHRSFRQLMQEADAVVALCQWTKNLLISNGVTPEKICLSRHGLSDEVQLSSNRCPADQRPLRIAFLGRMDPTKGADIVINAIRLLPELEVTLDLFGITQGTESSSYFEELKSLAANDSRISFHPAVPAQQVVDFLRDYHLLAVPSRWLETGPLVVLEAFAAGIPVLATNLGGMAELVTSGLDGLLVQEGSPEIWAGEIQKLAADRTLLRKLTDGVRSPRSMKDVASEMLAIYQATLPEAQASPLVESYA